MNPESLLKWEGVLKSQVAVSLLLLGALLLCLAWCWSQTREIRRLQREMREYLLGQADLDQIAKHMREVIALSREAKGTDGTDGEAPGVAARAAS